MHDDEPSSDPAEQRGEWIVYERHERQVTSGDGTGTAGDEHEQVLEPPPEPPPSPPSHAGFDEPLSEGDAGELGDRILGPPDD